MKRIVLSLLFCCFWVVLLAQTLPTNEYAEIDKQALAIPEELTATTDEMAGWIHANFSSDEERVRAAFIWVATNLSYDLENMFAIDFYETQEQKVAKALQTRKGICENYAALFCDLCSKVGLRICLVDGYTRQSGFVDYIPHVWCAALIDNTWYIFDPTWGSGYVKNGKFFRKIDNAYYKISPSAIIKSHMPFDYLWQFSNYPVTTQEFYEGRIQRNESKPYFDFADSIRVYEASSPMEQLEARARRIEQNGVKNTSIFTQLQYIKMELERLKNEKEAEQINYYNSALADYNEGAISLNDYINYRNSRFNPMKSDDDIRAMLDTPIERLRTAFSKLRRVEAPQKEQISLLVEQLSRSLELALNAAMEHQEWLTTYLGKTTAGRKIMLLKN